MKNYILAIFMCCINLVIYAQKDSLSLGDKYFDDQFYVNVSYNSLYNQPSALESSSFSYGLSGGYIRDIPVSESGKFGFGAGVGYGYESYSHGMRPLEASGNNFVVVTDETSNAFRVHNLEIPLQIRFRNSDVNRYSFWRIYAGFQFTYNLHNTFSYTKEGQSYNFNNIDTYAKWRTGLSLSVGYGTFNLYAYYGLSSLFKEAYLVDELIHTKVYKLGLSFYIL